MDVKKIMVQKTLKMDVEWFRNFHTALSVYNKKLAKTLGAYCKNRGIDLEFKVSPFTREYSLNQFYQEIKKIIDIGELFDSNKESDDVQTFASKNMQLADECFKRNDFEQAFVYIKMASEAGDPKAQSLYRLLTTSKNSFVRSPEEMFRKGDDNQ